MLFDVHGDTIPRRFYYQELLGGANQQAFSSQTSSGHETPGQTELSRKTTTYTHQSKRTRWSEGEVKILITVYRQEYERKDRGRSQDVMWEKIAERVNSESTEINSFAGKKDAKQCREKITNLNKKYKNVKDKSKATGEGSEEIKGFPEFADLDEMWGIRDIVTNKYVVEAGTNDQPIDADETSTISNEPYSQSPSSDPSLQSSQSDDDDSIFDVPLSACVTKNRKRALDEEDATTPPQTTPSRAKRPLNSLSSKASSSKSPSPPPPTPAKGKKGPKPKQRKHVADEEEDAYLKLLKVQTENAKRREEERDQLFSYLKTSDEQTHNLMISAIRELGEVLKAGNSSKT